MSNLPTSFYGRTWHDTRENALKCPPCKRVVLAEEAAAALDSAHDDAIAINRMMDGQREQDAYTLVRQGLRVKVPPTGVIPGLYTHGSPLYTGKPGSIVHVCPQNGMKVTDVEMCSCDDPLPNPLSWQAEQQNRAVEEMKALNTRILAGNPFAGKFSNRGF